MTAVADSFDLGRLQLKPGQGFAGDVAVRLDSLELGGQRYAVEPQPAPVRLEVSRTMGGWALRIVFAATLRGPCMRCLAEAERRLEVEAREVDQAGGAEELESPYVEGDVLALGAWARDALALALPQQVLCREDCRGLCAVCGADLNQADPADHRHDTGGDERWAKLRELEL